MLMSKHQINEEEVCDVCGETVTECYLLWHPRQNWKGVWLTLCEFCFENMEINL